MITAIALVLLGLIAGAYALLIYGLRRIVHIWEGRDVMDRFRPNRRKVADLERQIDDIHYDVVVGS